MADLTHISSHDQIEVSNHPSGNPSRMHGTIPAKHHLVVVYLENSRSKAVKRLIACCLRALQELSAYGVPLACVLLFDNEAEKSHIVTFTSLKINKFNLAGKCQIQFIAPEEITQYLLRLTETHPHTAIIVHGKNIMSKDLPTTGSRLFLSPDIFQKKCLLRSRVAVCVDNMSSEVIKLHLAHAFSHDSVISEKVARFLKHASPETVMTGLMTSQKIGFHGYINRLKRYVTYNTIPSGKHNFFKQEKLDMFNNVVVVHLQCELSDSELACVFDVINHIQQVALDEDCLVLIIDFNATQFRKLPDGKKVHNLRQEVKLRYRRNVKVVSLVTWSALNDLGVLIRKPEELIHNLNTEFALDRSVETYYIFNHGAHYWEEDYRSWIQFQNEPVVVSVENRNSDSQTILAIGKYEDYEDRKVEYEYQTVIHQSESFAEFAGEVILGCMLDKYKLSLGFDLSRLSHFDLIDSRLDVRGHSGHRLLLKIFECLQEQQGDWRKKPSNIKSRSMRLNRKSIFIRPIPAIDGNDAEVDQGENKCELKTLNSDIIREDEEKMNQWAESMQWITNLILSRFKNEVDAKSSLNEFLGMYLPCKPIVRLDVKMPKSFLSHPSRNYIFEAIPMSVDQGLMEALRNTVGCEAGFDLYGIKYPASATFADMLITTDVTERQQFLVPILAHLGRIPELTAILQEGDSIHTVRFALYAAGIFRNELNKSQNKTVVEYFQTTVDVLEQLAKVKLQESHECQKQLPVVVDDVKLNAQELACMAKARSFLAEPACKRGICQVWWGELAHYSFWKILLVLLLPCVSKQTNYFLVYDIPGVKCLFHGLYHLILILLYSYMIVAGFGESISLVEWVVLAWIIVLIIDDVLQLLYQRQKNNIKSSWILFTFYICSVWNKLDSCIFLWYVTAFTVRCVYVFSLEKPQPEAARILFSLIAILLYVRFLQFFTLHPKIGPLIMMIGKMFWRDIVPFMCILLVILIGYGVSLYSIINPSTPELPLTIDWTLVDAILRAPYLQLYAEVDFDDALTPEFRNYLGLVLVCCYILFTNVLLLNLLIAMFNSSYKDVLRDSEYHSYQLMYDVWVEFERKSVFPPPFSWLHSLCNPVVHNGTNRLCCSTCSHISSCNLYESSIFGLVKLHSKA